MVKKLHSIMSKRKAFTLMELLIVIAIIAILTVAFLPNALNAPKKARDAVRIKKVQDIQTAVEAYIAENSKLPADADGADKTANNCFVDSVAVILGMTVITDASDLNSCEGTGGLDKYYFKSLNVDAVVANRHYIIGAKVEVSTSANSKKAKDDLDTAADLSAAKALIESTKPAAGGTYFLAVGPI